MLGLSPLRLSASLSPIFFIYACNFIALPQTGSSSPTLEFGKPIEREIKGGETHSYELRLELEQFVGDLSRGCGPRWRSARAGCYRLVFRGTERETADA